MTPSEQIHDLQTVARAREWFRQHGHTLTTAQHVAFINRMQALIKAEAKE
jgi:hypothetical protein